MDKVRKTFFDPLARTKDQIRHILETKPVGSAHPFSQEKILLCKTSESGTIEEIDISEYPEDYFYNALDLGEMGEILLKRMADFPKLRVFDDFQIMQAPSSTFAVPISAGHISILAVSERKPTYYDLCLADASSNTCCYGARTTFRGVDHSGDINHGSCLLHYIDCDPALMLEGKELCVFISGFQYTRITAFLGTHPALMVADHDTKMLYIVPVPLDSATIGDATLCAPLVVKRNGNSLVCSILPKATTDSAKMCSGSTLESRCFTEAFESASFTLPTKGATSASGRLSKKRKFAETGLLTLSPDNSNIASESATAAGGLTFEGSTLDTISGHLKLISAKEVAIIATCTATIPPHVSKDAVQIIRFGTGLQFDIGEEIEGTAASEVVLPCVFGSQLEGPPLLATGRIPTNVPFLTESEIRDYYQNLKDMVVIVDAEMTDNARNLTSPWRLNALFIVQSAATKEAFRTTEIILETLNSTNINAVTALAGPQSLVLVQIDDKYFFYRGLGNPAYIETSKLTFGSDVTDIVQSLIGKVSLVDARVKRVVDINDKIPIILPQLGQTVYAEDLANLFADASLEQIKAMEDDFPAAIPQLQLVLNQKDLQELSASLVATLSAKISEVVAPLRSEYISFVKEEHNADDPASVRKKGDLLGALKKQTKAMQTVLTPVISSFATMMSTQNTSKRTHDLKKLVRQAQIQGNVKATENMTFETMTEHLEMHAADMGVMLVNIETDAYQDLLRTLGESAIVDASRSCSLDSRLLHLDGFDAGILIEQGQDQHDGPLKRQSAGTAVGRPIMALPYLTNEYDNGSMLAWACWDEFVNLDTPYATRWLDKCNEPHIAALRIITRDTLANATSNREHNYTPGSTEITELMSALLMSSMSKLAAMRTSAPSVVVGKPEDTVTLLMRGLFGNLLTVAGAGLKPTSMVWQLFGLHPQLDLPSTPAEWVWYETVVRLYPYTGWPLRQFHNNLEMLLDKALVRVVTKNENTDAVKASKSIAQEEYCKLRNVELAHSRTIVEVLERTLPSNNAGKSEQYDIAAIAQRLLAHVPDSVPCQSGGYPRMINYLKDLADGQPMDSKGNKTLADAYTKRSAVFSAFKAKIGAACKAQDWQEARHVGKALFAKHAEVAALWGLESENLHAQNLKAYRDLETLGATIDGEGKPTADAKALYNRIMADAEKKRVPWELGNKKGRYGEGLEPLDEGWVQEMLTGTRPDLSAVVMSVEQPAAQADDQAVQKKQLTVEEEFIALESSMYPSFIKKIVKPMTAEDVCKMLNIPVSTMEVFIASLNPEYVWMELPAAFKPVLLALIKNRSGRSESRPTRRLLALKTTKGKAQIGNALAADEQEE